MNGSGYVRRRTLSYPVPFQYSPGSMAASSMCRDESDQFMQWLESRLLQLNADLDVSVFVMYICGILESYSGYDDKKEVLLDIVGEIAVRQKVTILKLFKVNIHKTWKHVVNDYICCLF